MYERKIDTLLLSLNDRSYVSDLSHGYESQKWVLDNTSTIAAVRNFNIYYCFWCLSITSIIDCYRVGFHVVYFLLSIVVIIIVIFSIIIVSVDICASVVSTIVSVIRIWRWHFVIPWLCLSCYAILISIIIYIVFTSFVFVFSAWLIPIFGLTGMFLPYFDPHKKIVFHSWFLFYSCFCFIFLSFSCGNINFFMWSAYNPIHSFYKGWLGWSRWHYRYLLSFFLSRPLISCTRHFQRN